MAACRNKAPCSCQKHLTGDAQRGRNSGHATATSRGCAPLTSPAEENRTYLQQKVPKLSYKYSPASGTSVGSTTLAPSCRLRMGNKANPAFQHKVNLTPLFSGDYTYSGGAAEASEILRPLQSSPQRAAEPQPRASRCPRAPSHHWECPSPCHGFQKQERANATDKRWFCLKTHFKCPAPPSLSG